ncbi:MAG: membrane protein insertase YidC [bacterium]
MIDKKFFLALSLSLLTVLGLQYFFSGKGEQKPESVEKVQQPIPGQPIKVAATQELFRPLNMNVTFEEKQAGESANEILTDVQTPKYKAVFSNYGAVLTSFQFSDHKGKDGLPLKTISRDATKCCGNDVSVDERAKGCFLLALEENTPFKYQFLHKQDKTIDQHNVVEVAYQTETEFWIIQKIYSLYQDSYKVDLTVKFEPRNADAVKPLRARILVSSPCVTEIEPDPVNVFVFNESKDAVNKIDLNATQDLAWHWVTPNVMFGAEDKYFVHSMVNDSAKFVQRAYVKKIDTKTVSAVFEGPELTEAKSFNLSFYIGPKVLESMSVVDNRLVDLLAFGWLSWICKLLLKLLFWLFGLIGNYGWAIVVMTILIRLPFIPLSIFSRKKMEDYQRFQPTIQRIRQKYKHDLKMQNQELMKFHVDHNLSTATPLLGCLPLLIQMPILFALYRVLGNYLDLYQAPFFGWIIDLSAKDPYYVIPVLMGLTMLWQQAMTPSSDEKQKVMMYFVSIVMTVLFANFPVGLVLYWTMNNIITLLEDYFRKYVLR